MYLFHAVKSWWNKNEKKLIFLGSLCQSNLSHLRWTIRFWLSESLFFLSEIELFSPIEPKVVLVLLYLNILTHPFRKLQLRILFLRSEVTDIYFRELADF